MTIDDKDWLIIKVVAEEKNLTKAAERLFISQPALTYRIQNIEKEFGAKIITRHNNGILLTPQGEDLLAYAEEMLLQFRRAKERIKNIGENVQGSLRLGTSSVFAHYRLPKILKNFLELYPDIEVSLKTGLSRHIYRMLQKEDISLAIIRGDYSWIEEKHLISEEPICLVSAQPIEFTDLPHKPQISYLTDSSLEPIIEKWWNEHFARPPLITMEVDSMDTCRQMVLNGLGWAILPAIGLNGQLAPYTRQLSWINGKPLTRRTWLMYHTKMLELSTVQAFTDYIKNSPALGNQ